MLRARPPMSQAMKPPTQPPPVSAPEVDDDGGCCEHGAAAVFKLRRAARAFQALPPKCACECGLGHLARS